MVEIIKPNLLWLAGIYGVAPPIHVFLLPPFFFFFLRFLSSPSFVLIIILIAVVPAFSLSFSFESAFAVVVVPGFIMCELGPASGAPNSARSSTRGSNFLKLSSFFARSRLVFVFY